LFTGVFALALLFQTASPDPNMPLMASWNTSPTGAGSTRLPPAADARDGWEVHDLVGRHDWLRFQIINGAPQVLLNTRSRVVSSAQLNFTITAMSPMPYSVEFTCQSPGGTDWAPVATPLVITITGSP
jgi:hypothetical protein